MAMNRHYNKSPMYKSARGRKQARTFDMNTADQVVDDSRYSRSPHRYDYAGLDVGSRSRGMSGDKTAAQKRAAMARRAKALGSSSMAGGYKAMNSESESEESEDGYY